MKLLHEMLAGLDLWVDTYTSPRRYQKSGGFTTDVEKLRGDVVMVGSDIRKAYSMAQSENKAYGNTRSSGHKGF